jgi:hypothetical protein
MAGEFKKLVYRCSYTKFNLEMRFVNSTLIGNGHLPIWHF